ncbi:hypothetical protein Tco_1351297 [Tanacetum coccineum]
MMVFDEFLVNDMLSDERVLHKIVIVDEGYKVVEQLVRAVIDIVMDYTKNDGCCSLKFFISSRSYDAIHYNRSVLKLAIEDKVDKVFAVFLIVTPRLGGNTRRNIMDIITTQWCRK